MVRCVRSEPENRGSRSMLVGAGLKQVSDRQFETQGLLKLPLLSARHGAECGDLEGTSS